MMRFHDGDYPLPPGIVRPVLPQIPIARPAAAPPASTQTSAAGAPPANGAVPDGERRRWRRAHNAAWSCRAW